MNVGKAVKSSQEQAVGAWINYLNQVRLDRLVASLSQQKENFVDAMATIESAFSTIKEDIIGRNRGGDRGMHGFIAEIAECGIGNARQQIAGKAPTHVWINDNGPVDIMRGTDAIQQKFVQSGGHLSLRAVAEHLHHYPDYLTNGGKYQIPKDHYDKITAYLSMSQSAANKLPTSNGEFSLHQWKEVHAFFASGNIDIKDLEPSILEYKEVQKGTITATIDYEKEHLSEIDWERRDKAYQDSKPKLTEGEKATAVAAAVEGLTTFCAAIIRKRKEGKKFRDFGKEDWIEIACGSGKGVVQGSIRGASIYLLTNFTATPAAVASAMATASFGVAEQAHLFRNGKITETRFIENAEMLCMDAAVSALTSFVGQVIIPIPILGAVIGNAVGTLIYQIAKDSFTANEQRIIEKYLQDLNTLDQELTIEYSQYIKQLNKNYSVYMKLLDNAFNCDIERALKGSVELAKQMGVPTDELLTNYQEIATYFTE